MTKIIRADADGLRIDVFLTAHFPDMTRSAIQKLLEAGHVRLDGNPVKKNRKTSVGEMYEITIPDVVSVGLDVQDIPLHVAYEDSDVIVVNKPKGMVVHPAPGHSDGTLVNALMYHCSGNLSGINGELRPGIVHRIDKDTSGLIIAAKNDAAHRGLAAQLKDHTLSRIYDAVVCGKIKDECGTIDAPIGRHPTDRKRQTVTQRNSRPAITHYEVIGRYNGYTHVRCILETGRTHQIRVHMAHIGHPLLGDMVYGRNKTEKGLTGQCLHARTLKFVHPRTGEQMVITTELPEYFKEALEKLGPEAG